MAGVACGDVYPGHQLKGGAKHILPKVHFGTSFRCKRGNCQLPTIPPSLLGSAPAMEGIFPRYATGWGTGCLLGPDPAPRSSGSHFRHSWLLWRKTQLPSCCSTGMLNMEQWLISVGMLEGLGHMGSASHQGRSSPPGGRGSAGAGPSSPADCQPSLPGPPLPHPAATSEGAAVSWHQPPQACLLINWKCHLLPNCIITVYNFDCSFAYEN